MKYAGSGLVLSLSVCAGGLVGVASADEPVVALAPSHGHVVQAAHIYYNIATGERLVTLLDDGQTAPAANGNSVPIWSVLGGNPCADAGFTTSFFYGFDNNAGTTSLATAITVLDYGDISVDTVVDCVHIDWVTGHDDVDANSDGIGDGVVGLGGRWTWWDADNGRSINSSTRLPLISFAFNDLPGNIFGEGAFTSYSVDVDLAGSFSNSMTFEIGTTDHDSQGASFFHDNIDTDGDGVGDGVPISLADMNFDGFPDSDLDGDGLFDWAWSVRFFQPGTADQDGDGVIDGDLADSMHTIGINLGVPAGTAIDNGDGTWTWQIDLTPADAATGEEDRYVIFSPPDTNGDIFYVGGFWFGGFECSSVPLPDGPGYTPLAMFEHQLFGPSGVICPWDTNGDGELNFFDISQVIIFFTNHDPLADFNHDGEWNFFDISIFLNGFLGGCP